MFFALNKWQWLSWQGGRILLVLLVLIGVVRPVAGADEPLPGMPAAGAVIDGLHYRIKITGNQTLGKKELQKAAAAELADAESSGISAAQADDAAFLMESAYRQKGFAFAAVNYAFSDELSQTPLVTFQIEEGPRVQIKELNLPGVSQIPERVLLPFFEEGLDGSLERGTLIFVESAIRSAIGEMRDYYYNEGFKNIEIAEPDLVFAEDHRTVTVTIQVREGNRYTIKTMAFSGDLLSDANAELEQLKIDVAGKSYFRRRELIAQSRIKEIYGNLGYPDTVVQVESQISKETGEVGLTAAIESGPKVTIVALVLPENIKTSQEYIRNRLAVKPGDTYSLAKKNQSFQELYKTGLFSRIEFELIKGESPENRRLKVDVEELPSKEISFEAGYGSYEQLRFQAEARENNLWGSGRVLKTSGSLSFVGERLETSIADPFWFGTEITAELPVYYLRRQEPSFTRQELGASVLFSRAFFEDWKGALGYNLRSTKTLAVDLNASQDVQGTDYNLVSIKMQVSIDRRNDIFLPSRGYAGFLAAETAEDFLGSQVTFTRFTGGARYFRPGPAGTVFGLRYGVGIILPGSQNITVPVAEKFFNGGENSVRSFRESELGPHDINGEPTGGLGYNTINLELRRRIAGNWAGSFFVDFGNISPNRSRSEEGLPAYTERSEVVSDTLDDFFSGFRTGVGLGLQYLLPVGPVRIDYAMNPNPDQERGERDWVVHLSVGMAF